MSTTPVTTPDDLMRSLVAEAMLKHLDQATRDRLIQNALKSLIDPTDVPGAYGRKGPSKLEEAFNQAAYGVALKLMNEMVKEEPFQNQLRELIRTAVEKMSVDKEDLAGRLATAITDSMKPRY